MVDTVINLGGFTFENMEIPESINFGGEQAVKVHDLIGGTRIIDAMGGQEGNISWSGLMLGPDAMSRAQQLDQMRVSGQSINLSVFSLSYEVIIKKFVFKTQRYYQIEYEIELATIQNNNNSAGLLGALGLTGSILSDLSAANAIAGLIGFPSISASMGNLTSAVSGVPSFESATPAQLSSVSTAASEVTPAITDTQASLNAGVIPENTNENYGTLGDIFSLN